VTRALPAPGEIWQTADGTHALVAGVDGSHVVACSVAVWPDGTVTAHPRGRKAERVLLPEFRRGRFVAKAVAR